MMKFIFLNLLLILTQSSNPVASIPLNETSLINIHLPQTLYQIDGYKHHMAHFGYFHSSHGSMALNLYYAESHICDYPVNKSKGVPARDINPHTNEMMPWPQPYILMTNRGGCSFVTKARHAQMSGAAAVIVADTHCLCSDEECQKNQPSNAPPCQDEEPVMADDGSGGDISIPAFLIYKQDADVIKKELGKNVPVLVDVRWHKPQVTESMDYSLWMDPLEDPTKNLVREFKPAAMALDKVHFHPHYVLHDGKLSNCHDNDSDEFGCSKACTNHGRYCYPSMHYPGSKVVAEILRRLCIWKHHHADEPNVWWDYVTHFDEHCGNSNVTFLDSKCQEKSYQYAHVSAEEVEACMKDSGALSDDTQNSLLDDELAAKMEYGVFSTPVVRVNHQTLRWPTPDARSVMENICNGFQSNALPHVCQVCGRVTDPLECAAANALKPSKNDTKKSGHGIWTSLFLISIVGGAGFWYYKRSQEEQFGGTNWNYSQLLGGHDGAS